jgi:hypothetical protein
MEGQGPTAQPVAPTPGTPTPAFTPVPASNRIKIADAPVVVGVIGGIVGIIGTFLKGVTIPANLSFDGSTTYVNTTGGAKIILGAAIVATVLLVVGRVTHRRALPGVGIAVSAIAALFAAINAAGGFTLTLVDGGTQHADPAVGVFVALVGVVVLLISMIWAIRSAKPEN